MRPIEMEHTEYAWELQPAAMPVIRSSGAKSMRGSGAAGSQPVDDYFPQRLVDVRPPGMWRLQLFKQLSLSAKHAALEAPMLTHFSATSATPLTGRVCARRNQNSRRRCDGK